MINTILSIFDNTISSRCYVEKYGRVAVTAKQAVHTGEGRHTYRRFPISCALVNNCETLSGYFADLLPDDSKKGVAFWKLSQPINYENQPGMSFARRVKRGTAYIDLLYWGNLSRILSESEDNAWCNTPEIIQADMIRLIECGGRPMSTGNAWLQNVRLEVVQIGQVSSWRQAMSEYSIDNVEALSVWPYVAFTLKVMVTFVSQMSCMPSFVCAEGVPCFETDVPPDGELPDPLHRYFYYFDQDVSGSSLVLNTGDWAGFEWPDPSTLSEFDGNRLFSLHVNGNKLYYRQNPVSIGEFGIDQNLPGLIFPVALDHEVVQFRVKV